MITMICQDRLGTKMRNIVRTPLGDMCDVRDLAVHSDFGEHYEAASEPWSPRF